MEIKERIQLLLSEMNRGVYEKEAEIGLSLLAALAGESILLLGPPGVAKSMVARRLKRAFVDARAFEYLMSRFSTPDEIFGPVSISRLKESDKYERAVDGYLPTADVVFLDEIWKAGPAIQNTLLTVINEKLFRNGDTELKLPLKLLVAASNELPTQGEGLEALWDRFLIRIISTCVKQEEAFYQMLLDDDDEEEQEACRWQISDEEYAGWQKEIRQIKVSAEVLSCITEIRKNLEKVEIQGSEVHRNVYVSDRRWKNIVKLLKASAFIHGRKEVCLTDLLPVYHCLWNEPEECADIRQIVVRALFVPYVKEIVAINLSLKSDLKVSRVREALEKARQKGDRRDDDLMIIDHFYYQIENHGTGNTYIFIVDYKNLKEYSPKDVPATGVMYADPGKVRLFSFYKLYGDSSTFNGAVNKGFKRVVQEVNESIEKEVKEAKSKQEKEELRFFLIPEDTKAYSVRHSWATIARNVLNISKDDIDLCLNHVNEAHKMADVYIDKDFTRIDQANRRMFDLLFQIGD